MLGDLALCTGIIRREAIDQGKSLDAHTAHMLVHGILHLHGYDHEEDREAREMEQVEAKILEKFGFADPYMEQAGQGDNDHE